MNDIEQPAGPLSVTQLTLLIKSNLEDEFSSVWVSGEVSGVKKYASGHIYFTMKDAGAQLPAVMWRSAVPRLKFELRDGMEVVARGRLGVYPPHGKYQLEADRLEPVGLGARELALRQLKERLLAKGYFQPERKRKLPLYPQRIAIITSPSGAAVRDMLQVLTTRWRLVEVLICPVRVQGDEAADEIAAAIRLLNRLHHESALPIDLLIVGRGGGSSEDLWVFNAEIIADAIFTSRIPVVSAVGHEIDVSVCDLVADLHALTPTDAANRVVPDAREMAIVLRDWRNRMEDALQRRLTESRRALESIASRNPFQKPLARLREREERLDDLAGRLHRAIKQKTSRAEQVLAGVVGRLESLSPLNVLRRGYSLTRTEGGSELLRNASRVRPGDRLLTTLAQGEIVSRVEAIVPSVPVSIRGGGHPVKEDDRSEERS